MDESLRAKAVAAESRFPSTVAADANPPLGVVVGCQTKGSSLVPNLIGETWARPDSECLPIYNPATSEVIDEVPLSPAGEVERAVEAAAVAFQAWSRAAVIDRTRLMFRFKALLEQHVEEIAAIITWHTCKTFEEARGETRRGIEVVDYAYGAPTLLQGRTVRQVTAEVDQDLYRYQWGSWQGSLHSTPQP